MKAMLLKEGTTSPRILQQYINDLTPWFVGRIYRPGIYKGPMCFGKQTSHHTKDTHVVPLGVGYFIKYLPINPTGMKASEIIMSRSINRCSVDPFQPRFDRMIVTKTCVRPIWEVFEK